MADTDRPEVARCPWPARRGGARVTDEIRVDLQLVRAILDGTAPKNDLPMNASPPEPSDPLPSDQQHGRDQLGLFGEPSR